MRKNGTNVERRGDDLQIEAEQTGVMVVVFPKRGVGRRRIIMQTLGLLLLSHGWWMYEWQGCGCVAD